MPQTSAIGVLDLQGGVCEHLDHLERLGVARLPVKEAADFQDLAGLIIPGGESTCLSRLLQYLFTRQGHRPGVPAGHEDLGDLRRGDHPGPVGCRGSAASSASSISRWNGTASAASWTVSPARP